MFTNGLKGICNYLGKNNDAVFVVLAVAIFKGVFRPTFTMMDKHEKPEVKRYAAFREGLTEVIAFLTYLGTSFMAKTLASPICKAAGKVDKVTGKVDELAKETTKKSLSFLAVCLAAGFVIPAVCNLTLKPVMDKVFKKDPSKNHPDEQNNKILDIKENDVPEIIQKPQFNPVLSEASKQLLLSVKKPLMTTNSNMKVGG